MTIIITSGQEAAMLADALCFGYGLQEAGEIAIEQSLEARVRANYERLCEKAETSTLTEDEEERLHMDEVYLAGGLDAY